MIFIFRATLAVCLAIGASAPNAGRAACFARFNADAVAAQPKEPAGFSIQQVDGEYDQQPLAPRADDQMISTDQGRFYWLRSPPVISGEIVAVRARADGDNYSGASVFIQLTPTGRRLFRDFTSGHVGARIAFVLNGRMLTDSPTIMMPIDSEWLSIPMPSAERASAVASELSNAILGVGTISWKHHRLRRSAMVRIPPPAEIPEVRCRAGERGRRECPESGQRLAAMNDPSRTSPQIGGKAQGWAMSLNG